MTSYTHAYVISGRIYLMLQKKKIKKIATIVGMIKKNKAVKKKSENFTPNLILEY